MQRCSGSCSTSFQRNAGLQTGQRELTSARQCGRNPALLWQPRITRGGVTPPCSSLSGNQAHRFRQTDLSSTGSGPPHSDGFASPWDSIKLQGNRYDPNSPEAEASRMPPPPDEYWSTDQPGEVRVRNRYATHARLAPAGIPSSPDGEEYYVVELQRDYSKEWPSIKTAPDGSLAFRPGFLAPLTDPELPAYYFYRQVL
jgi:hypothetical protein